MNNFECNFMTVIPKYYSKLHINITGQIKLQLKEIYLRNVI